MYKIQAVRLGREIGFVKAAMAMEPGISVDTFYGWKKQAKKQSLPYDPEPGLRRWR